MVNLRQSSKMKEITKVSVSQEHDKSPLKKCFHQTGVQKEKLKPTFSVAIESAKKVFEAQTGLEFYETQNLGNYWRYVDANEIKTVEAWEKDQGSRIFLRDCLSLSIALDYNFKDNTSGQHTRIGELESQAKCNQDQDAINELVSLVVQTINELQFYKEADLICSVPPRPDNDFNLPSSVTSLVSTKIGKQDITGDFVFGGQKSSVKTSTFDEKWSVWERAQLSFQNSQVKDKTIVLIDDKYQSGISIQYVAMKLQQAGARQVYGLCFVKTLRDTGNV